MDWPEFIGLVRRSGQYDVRTLLGIQGGVARAIGLAFGGGDDPKTRNDQSKLLELAGYSE